MGKVCIKFQVSIVFGLVTIFTTNRQIHTQTNTRDEITNPPTSGSSEFDYTNINIRNIIRRSLSHGTLVIL